MYSLFSLQLAVVEVVKEAVKDYRLKDPHGDLVPVNVYPGFIPRDGAGEIDTERVTDYPSVIVQASGAEHTWEDGTVQVRLLVGVADSSPDMQGHQDALNVIDSITRRFFRQRILANAFPLAMPYHWQTLDYDTFPVFVGIITSTWRIETPQSVHADTVYDD